MSRRIADLLIKIGADSYEFQQKAQQVEKGLSGLEKKLTSVGKQLSLKLTAPLVALGAVAVHAFDESERSATKVRQAIKSTGGAARLSFEELSRFAGELQYKTLFEDDFILNNATAQLLTFTNIAGENFKRTQAVALDLATVLDGDLKSASIQLGKALNDPVKNLTALSRAGIQFSKEQTATIKNLAETNRLAEAQTLILAELERQYGGQAEAAAKVGMGALQQLKNSWGDFLEQIGSAMMPFVNKIAAGLKVVVAGLQSLSPEMKQVIVVVAGITATIGPLALGVGGVIKLLPMLSVGLTALISPVGLVVAALVALGAAFAYARVQKQKMIAELADNTSLEELEKQLKENADKQRQISEQTTKWRIVPNMGGMVAGFTFQKIADPSQLAPLRKEQELLTSAITKKREAVEAANKAEQEANRINEETRKQTAELMAQMQGAMNQTEQATGLIGKLKSQIEALEKRKLLPESTVEDIATCNAEIAKLQTELQRLQNIRPEDLHIEKALPILPTDFTIELPAPKIKMDGIKLAVSQYSEQMKAIFTTVREGLYGWASDTSNYLKSNITDTVAMVENYTSALTAKGWSFTAALEHVSQTIAATMQRFDEQVSQFLADSIVTAAEALGQVIAGDLGFGGLMKAILTQFANFLKNIGAQLIEFGVMIIAFKSALSSVLANPWAAIGVGAAMVAAAALMTALINKNAKQSVPALATGGLAYGATYAMVGDNPNARVDPEVIAPLSKLQAMLPSTSTAKDINITLGGQLTAKGRDLVYVLGKENFKTAILGG